MIRIAKTRRGVAREAAELLRIWRHPARISGIDVLHVGETGEHCSRYVGCCRNPHLARYHRSSHLQIEPRKMTRRRILKVMGNLA